MHGLSAIDEGRVIDWGRTTGDYVAHRPGPPVRFYQCLQILGIGLEGQRILDLGTGTGVLARQFARQGSSVCGIDVAENQLDAARDLAHAENLKVEFRAAPAENVPYPDQTFDVITANQCWLYFDASKAISEVKRLLAANGLLVTSHFSWLPRLDPIAQATERLVRKYNPSWSAGDWSGEIPNCPAWATSKFEVVAMFFFDEDIAFTGETWRGRIRACRGIGAGLSEDEVKRFDAEHKKLLAEIAPPRFTVRHRIDAHLLRPR